MEYRRLQPCARLRDLVESIWIQHDDARPGGQPPSCVVPTGTVEVLFQYGEPVGHLGTDGVRRMPRSYVTGQRSRPVEVVAGRRIGIVLVSLYPWGLQPLFPGGVASPDGYVDLKLLGGASRVERLEEALALARSTRERVRLVESYLLRQRTGKADRRLALASRMLSRADLDHPLEQTAGELGISPRHLLRTFRSGIGIPPSVFLRVMRFQRAIRLHRRTGMPWAGVAAACGYSDQAHLIHEVRAFSGRSPGRIVLDDHPSRSTFNGDGVSLLFDTVYLGS